MYNNGSKEGPFVTNEYCYFGGYDGRGYNKLVTQNYKRDEQDGACIERETERGAITARGRRRRRDGKEGTWDYNRNDGTAEKTEHYKSNVLEGRYLEFNKNGDSIVVEGEYKYGAKSGLWGKRTSSGALKAVEFFGNNADSMNQLANRTLKMLRIGDTIQEVFIENKRNRSDRQRGDDQLADVKRVITEFN